MKKLLLIVTCAAFMAACDFPGSDIKLITGPAAGSSSGGSTPTPTPTPSTPALVSDIPSDDDAGSAPTFSSTTITIPSPSVVGLTREGHKVARVALTGIEDQNGSWLELLGTNNSGQNVWITVDDVDKGILVASVSANTSSATKTDIVFLVDNSGSMSEEADAVAESIIDWSNKLTAANLDVQFGCVGYDGSINGGIDLCSSTDMKTFLDRSTGTYRTVGFEGANAAALDLEKDAYNTSWGECGTAALRFADEHYTFRSGANRVYINFTDEPNQPDGKEDFSVEYLNPVNNHWAATQGTVHSVYSDSYIDFTEIPNYEEFPWKMAEYTGGTKFFTDSYFTGLTLSDLSVSGALLNSYTIDFTNIDSLLDGQTHKLVITIYTSDGIQGTLTVYINFSDLTY